jgi:hypothetical protein
LVSASALAGSVRFTFQTRYKALPDVWISQPSVVSTNAAQFHRVYDDGNGMTWWGITDDLTKGFHYRMGWYTEDLVEARIVMEVIK